MFDSFYQVIPNSKNSTNNTEGMIDLDFENWVCDSEIRSNKDFFNKDNPITEKFLILSQINEDTFLDAKPTDEESIIIEGLINTPDFIKLEDSEILLFWKYR